MNDVIKLKYFSRSWKLVKIIAIPKQGKDTPQLSNMRPISLLSNLTKFLIANWGATVF